MVDITVETIPIKSFDSGINNSVEKLSQEASTLGFKPGYFPDKIIVTLDDNKNIMFIKCGVVRNMSNDIAYYVYKAPHSGYAQDAEMRIWND